MINDADFYNALDGDNGDDSGLDEDDGDDNVSTMRGIGPLAVQHPQPQPSQLSQLSQQGMFPAGSTMVIEWEPSEVRLISAVFSTITPRAIIHMASTRT